MKLIYIANIRLPTEKAHGIQIMKTCESLALNGAQVTLVVPFRKNNIYEDPFKFYNCENIFKIKYLFNIDLIRFGKYGVRLNSLIFSVMTFFYILFNNHDIIYSRDEMPLAVSLLISKKSVWEVHDARGNIFMAALLRRLDATVTISNALKELYRDKTHGKIPVLLAPDGVDINRFNLQLSKNECREKTGLPLDKKIVLYTGSLKAWKGVDILASSVGYLNENILIIFIGGSIEEQNLFKKNHQNERIIMIPQKPPTEMPYYMGSADVLVLPNSYKEKVSRAYTSPMKLFEYMATYRPIVASDLSSIKEILNDSNSILVEPDNPKALAYGIEIAINNKELVNSITECAYKNVGKYDWKNRGISIIEFLKTI